LRWNYGGWQLAGGSETLPYEILGAGWKKWDKKEPELSRRKSMNKQAQYGFLNGSGVKIAAKAPCSKRVLRPLGWD